MAQSKHGKQQKIKSAQKKKNLKLRDNEKKLATKKMEAEKIKKSAEKATKNVDKQKRNLEKAERNLKEAKRNAKEAVRAEKKEEKITKKTIKENKRDEKREKKQEKKDNKELEKKARAARLREEENLEQEEAKKRAIDKQIKRMSKKLDRYGYEDEYDPEYIEDEIYEDEQDPEYIEDEIYEDEYDPEYIGDETYEKEVKEIPIDLDKFGEYKKGDYSFYKFDYEEELGRFEQKEPDKQEQIKRSEKPEAKTNLSNETVISQGKLKKSIEKLEGLYENIKENPPKTALGRILTLARVDVLKNVINIREVQNNILIARDSKLSEFEQQYKKVQENIAQEIEKRQQELKPLATKLTSMEVERKTEDLKRDIEARIGEFQKAEATEHLDVDYGMLGFNVMDLEQEIENLVQKSKDAQDDYDKIVEGIYAKSDKALLNSYGIPVKSIGSHVWGEISKRVKPMMQKLGNRINQFLEGKTEERQEKQQDKRDKFYEKVNGHFEDVSDIRTELRKGSPSLEEQNNFARSQTTGTKTEGIETTKSYTMR